MAKNKARRYLRQISLPEIGSAGQAKLAGAGVLIVGLGGLGSPAALYLAAAGVGRLGLIDADKVSLDNLQRQILYDTSDIGRRKAEAAAERLTAINPDCRIEICAGMLSKQNAASRIAGYDAVVDGTDSFAAKFMIAQACHAARKPYSHAGITGFKGHALTVRPGISACCRCLFDKPASSMPKSSARGPMGPLPGIIGSVQAAEIIKLITGAGEPLINRLLVCDCLSMDLRVLPMKRNKNCPLCGQPSRRRSATNA